MEKQLDTSWVKLRKEVLELMRHAIRMGDYQYAKELKALSQELKKQS